jgi:hypothetical protein
MMGDIPAIARRAALPGPAAWVLGGPRPARPGDIQPPREGGLPQESIR